MLYKSYHITYYIIHWFHKRIRGTGENATGFPNAAEGGNMHDGAVPNLIAGDVAVVTGGAQGNGAAIAIGLAASGAAVLVVDLNGDGAQATAGLITAKGGKATGVGLDVANRADCIAFGSGAAGAFGR